MRHTLPPKPMDKHGQEIALSHPVRYNNEVFKIIEIFTDEDTDCAILKLQCPDGIIYKKDYEVEVLLKE